MKSSFKNLTIISVFLLVSSSYVFSQSDSELKSKIEKINKDMAAAMVAGNTEKSLSYYTQDAISMPAYEKMHEGKDDIKKSNEEMMKSGSKITAFETTTQKVMSCDKNITEIGTYKISFTMAGKPDAMKDHGKYVTMWEKQPDGSLKVKLEIWNSDMNPMEMGKMQ